MTHRERVNSPDELRLGDRVEVHDIGRRAPGVVVIDLLYRAKNWWGFVVGVEGAVGSSPNGHLITIGDEVSIWSDNYAAGRVFIRRRSREDHHVTRVAEVQG
jgi:hypothetical protein